MKLPLLRTTPSRATRATLLGAALALGTGAAALDARPTTGTRDAATPRARVASAAPGDSVTAAARAQLATARRATAALATPEAARAAGYRPMFGHVPLQGEHYVRFDLVVRDSFDLERPSVLMFAPVAGTPTLVGVAYAFLRDAGAPAPVGFDGAGDAWHSHARLSPVRGRNLVMMHAWFVEAPEGPFARYNPWLPFLATGLTPPSAGMLADSAAGERERRLGLAIALATTPPMLFEVIERQAGAALAATVAPHRAAITALVPRLAAAERAGDRASRQRLAGEAVAHADAMIAAWRDAAPERPLVRRLVDRTVEEFLGRGHGVEEELEALMGGATGAGHAHPAPGRPAPRSSPHQH